MNSTAFATEYPLLRASLREAEEALNRQHFAQEKGCRCVVS